MKDRGFFPPIDDQNPFTDVLFNALLGFAFMFSVAFIMIRPEITEGKVNPKAEFLITAQWPDNHPDDIGSLLMLGEQIAGQSDKNEKGEGRFHFNAGIASRCRVSRRPSV